MGFRRVAFALGLAAFLGASSLADDYSGADRVKKLEETRGSLVIKGKREDGLFVREYQLTVFPSGGVLNYNRDSKTGDYKSIAFFNSDGKLRCVNVKPGSREEKEIRETGEKAIQQAFEQYLKIEAKQQETTEAAMRRKEALEVSFGVPKNITLDDLALRGEEMPRYIFGRHIRQENYFNQFVENRAKQFKPPKIPPKFFIYTTNDRVNDPQHLINTTDILQTIHEFPDEEAVKKYQQEFVVSRDGNKSPDVYAFKVGNKVVIFSESYKQTIHMNSDVPILGSTRDKPTRLEAAKAAESVAQRVGGTRIFISPELLE